MPIFFLQSLFRSGRAPSLHVKGERYCWEHARSFDDVLIQPAPSWVIEAMHAGRVSAEPKVVLAGGRNSRLMSLAGRLRRDGAEKDAIYEALRLENTLSCRPPLDVSEVAAIAASASRYPAGGESSGVADLLRTAGVESLTEDSSTKDRENAIKCLSVGAVKLDPLQRAFLRSGLDDRAADNWESLFAIAQIAGGPWPERAYAAALGLSGAERAEEGDTHGEQLLSDIRSIFDDLGSGTLLHRK